MKNSNDIIGNRTRYFPSCNSVPQPTKNSERMVKIMIVSESLFNGVEQSSFEKLTVPQLVKKFPALYGTRWFVTVFITACRCSQCWNKSNQPAPSPSSSLISIYAVSFLPVLSILCMLISLMCATCPTHPPWFDCHNGCTVELGYNVLKGTGYFLSL